MTPFSARYRITDYDSAWQYARWKCDVATPNLASIHYNPDQQEEGLTNMWGPAGARTTTLGPAAFALGENKVASTLGHENVHGGQDRNLGEKDAEKPAYSWELQNAASTGISQEEQDYITEWIKWCDGSRPDKPTR